MKADRANRETWRLIREDLLHKRPVRNWDAYRQLLPKESGRVLSAGDGIAHVSGLPSCMYGEVIRFAGGQYGIAMNLEKEATGVVLISGQGLKSGDDCFSTGATVRVPTGAAVLGRVLSPLGQPLDDGPDFDEGIPFRPIEAPAPSILDRQPVRVSLETGITAIDAMVPIGRGQRELIIGDRQTGKTTIAQLHQLFAQTGALDYTTMVVASAADTAGLQYLAPYSGCAMAEAFMYEGKDCLVVYDDLTKHAQAYRAISLLLRRPPGREAFPGDVFYLHSRLLERAAQLHDDLGGGSMTALPIVETQAGDISAYIPTNIISITDGQIYLDTDIFIAGQRPAVNVGLSVSRVGGDAQVPSMREVAGPLRIALAQYREKKAFSQFATDLDDVTQRQLAKGDRLMLLLSQNPLQMRSLAKSLALLELGTRDLFSDIAPADLPRLAKFFIDALPDREAELVQILEAGQRLSEETREGIKAAWQAFLQDYQSH